MEVERFLIMEEGGEGISFVGNAASCRRGFDVKIAYAQMNKYAYLPTKGLRQATGL